MFATGSPDGQPAARVSAPARTGARTAAPPATRPSDRISSRMNQALADVDKHTAEVARLRGLPRNIMRADQRMKTARQINAAESKRLKAITRAREFKIAATLATKRENEAATASKERAVALERLQEKSDTAFDEVQADIEERQKVNEGLINSAAGFDASVGTRIDRVLPHATPAEAARLKELRRGGVNAASQGRPAGEIVEFEQSINQVITRIDARVAVDKGKGRDRANRRSLEDANERLAEADARLVAAGTPEAKAAAQKAKGKAQLDVEFARKAAGLGVGRGPSGGGGPKAMKPDAAGSKFAAIFKDARDNTLTDGGAIDPKDGLRGHSLEALVVGSFSNLHVNEAQRKVIWEVAEEMAAGIRTTGNPDSDRAAVKAKFESIREALGPELWTEETKTRVFLMLFGRGAGGLGA